MIRAVIIEDEVLIARQLESKIISVAPDVEIIETLPSLKTAKKWFLANAQPDLLFLDIQLSDGISFELFDHFNLTCPSIFITAYDEYALRAFKVNGIDYLLKPVDNADLQKAIDKARHHLAVAGTSPANMHDFMLQRQSLPQPGKLYKEKFVVNVQRQWVPVPSDQIAIFLKDQVIYIHTFNGQRYVTDYITLDEIEELLDPQYFYRANRQSIIHINAIKSIKPLENQKLVLTLSAPVNMQQDISREKAPGFKKWWDR